MQVFQKYKMLGVHSHPSSYSCAGKRVLVIPLLAQSSLLVMLL